MRTVYVRLLWALYLVSAASNLASACKCSSGLHGRNAWQNAREASERATAIFEGTPIRFELQWNLLSAKEGELVPAEAMSAKAPGEWPHMVITFQVQRTYKESLGSEVQLHTGLGGGDCGATQYDTGLSYLIFAGGDGTHLYVSICSPGGWIEDQEVKAQLRYLRSERAIPLDLEPIPSWSDPKYSAFIERRDQKYKERQKVYEAATGRICGTVDQQGRKHDSPGTIYFLSTRGYLPYGSNDVAIKEDGSFCTRSLGPGSYYLYFVGGGKDDPTAQYYPGVTDVANGQAIEVRAGQTESGISFRIGKSSAYSVRGLISADQKPNFKGVAGPTDVEVVLLRPDGDRRVLYATTASFLLPKLGYFKFDNVVPGHYFAYVMVPAAGWMTHKVAVDVTNHMKFISLDLVHKN